MRFETNINGNEKDIEEKKWKLPDGNSLSSGGNRGFDFLSRYLPKKDSNYDKDDIKWAANKWIDAIISNKRVSMGNLSIEEEERMNKLVESVKKGLNGNPAQMIEQFAEIRDWIVGTLSTSDGKSEKDKNNFLTSQRELENNDSANEDWQKSMQQLREFITKKESEHNTASEVQCRIAKKEWDRSLWIINMAVGKEAIDACLKEFPSI